jgi:hypothetical protein
MEQNRTARPAPSLAPEHDWTAASGVLRPAFRPVGTAGTDGLDRRLPSSNAGAGKPIMKAGPAGLPIVYVLPGEGFDVVVGVDHLLAWGVGPDRVHDAAIANLSEWSREAAWTDEVNDGRRVVWSDLGEGLDAARILLTDVRAKLAADLGPGCRSVTCWLLQGWPTATTSSPTCSPTTWPTGREPRMSRSTLAYSS